MNKRTSIVAATLIGGGLVLASAVGAGAAMVITGANVKDGSLTGKDIRNGSIGAVDLSASAKSQLRGATGPQGPRGATGPKGAAGTTGQTGANGQPGANGQDGARGPQGVPGTSFHSYTAGKGRNFPFAAGAPTDPPGDVRTWPLVLGTTMPSNTYDDVTVTLSSLFNYNNPDGLHCAVLFDDELVARAAHMSNSPTTPWAFTDVSPEVSAANGSADTGATYVGRVGLGALTLAADLDVDVRCYKAAGVATAVDVLVAAHVPLTKVLDVTSDPE